MMHGYRVVDTMWSTRVVSARWSLSFRLLQWSTHVVGTQ
ncbi:uncharacterized protein COLE_07258 [Cutaneotrichosporon oleaginosum]|nr:hypothetical protein COLE_07258 [Cutaneotrichosporon oleaginosum]